MTSHHTDKLKCPTVCVISDIPPVDKLLYSIFMFQSPGFLFRFPSALLVDLF